MNPKSGSNTDPEIDKRRTRWGGSVKGKAKKRNVDLMKLMQK